MQAKHLPEPEFVATFSSLKVIFWRNAQSERNTKAHSAASQTNSITEEASASSHKERMTQEASVLLELIQQNGEVGIAELKQLTGYSDSKIRARLNSLLDKKAITPTASKTSKNRKYRLS
jgi:predicted HTH transcriptional regulator